MQSLWCFNESCSNQKKGINDSRIGAAYPPIYKASLMQVVHLSSVHPFGSDATISEPATPLWVSVA